MKTKKLFVICFAVLCLSAAPAMADMYGTASVQYVDMIRGMTLYMTGTGGSGFMDAGLSSLDITLYLTGPDTIPADSYLYQGYEQAFCIDLYDETPWVAGSYDVLSLDAAPDPIAAPPDGMGLIKAAFIAELLIKNTYATAQDAAAVQVAIWEILEEIPYNWNVSNGQGNYYLATTGTGGDEDIVAGLANIMLGNLTTGQPFDRYTGLSNGTSGGFKQLQDYVVVPIPGAVLLGILGLGVVGWKLRKYA